MSYFSICRQESFADSVLRRLEEKWYAYYSSIFWNISCLFERHFPAPHLFFSFSKCVSVTLNSQLLCQALECCQKFKPRRALLVFGKKNFWRDSQTHVQFCVLNKICLRSCMILDCINKLWKYRCCFDPIASSCMTSGMEVLKGSQLWTEIIDLIHVLWCRKLDRHLHQRI